ncbi:MAG: KEOPS complex kinase/ATPase Bud32 [Candidatus Hadarchaeales archaeon]
MLLKKGAEADIFKERFSRTVHPAGKGNVVIKLRKIKKYRIPEIDVVLRESRTALEAKLISDAKRAGVPTPAIYHVDRKNTKIIMQYVKGKQVKHFMNEAKPEERKRICREIGKIVARLHRSGIAHGDLTTSNMILAGDDKVYLIDFGLGEYNSSTEARGVDLHLLRRALESVHFRFSKSAYVEVLKGYAMEFGKGAEEIINRAEEISRRGRYVEREERPWR